MNKILCFLLPLGSFLLASCEEKQSFDSDTGREVPFQVSQNLFVSLDEQGTLHLDDLEVAGLIEDELTGMLASEIRNSLEEVPGFTSYNTHFELLTERMERDQVDLTKTEPHIARFEDIEGEPMREVARNLDDLALGQLFNDKGKLVVGTNLYVLRPYQIEVFTQEDGEVDFSKRNPIKIIELAEITGSERLEKWYVVEEDDPRITTAAGVERRTKIELRRRDALFGKKRTYQLKLSPQYRSFFWSSWLGTRAAFKVCYNMAFTNTVPTLRLVNQESDFGWTASVAGTEHELFDNKISTPMWSRTIVKTNIDGVIHNFQFDYGSTTSSHRNCPD